MSEEYIHIGLAVSFLPKLLSSYVGPGNLFDREPTGRYREFVKALLSKESQRILTFWVDEDRNLAGTEESLDQLDAFSE